MSIAVTIDVQGLKGAMEGLSRLSGDGRAELMDALARLGALQTQRRIEAEKTTPEGRAWPLTRDGRSALFDTGTNLYQSIDHRSTDNTATWGTGWVGARVHQFGAVIRPKKGKTLVFNLGGKSVFAKSVKIPGRPFIGISRENEEQMREAAIDALRKIVS